MHGGRESDRAIVPRKRLHTVEGRATLRSRAQTTAAEAVEGRELAQGKTGAQTRVGPQRRSALQRARDRRRPAARRDHAQPLTALWHHVDESNRLREAEDGLHREAAAGVDGQPWAASGETLEANRWALSDRLKRGGAHARPVERVYLPTPDGRQGPSGIPTLEEKRVQRATVAVLNAIDEAECRGCASGGRPGRSPHDALDAVTGGMEQRHGNGVREADIRGCFDHMDHAGLVQCIAQRIGDQRVVRHRQKWLHAGVLEAGQGHAQEEGTPQGGRVRPLAAHISLHDVLDLWAARWRRQDARGEVIIVRYADACIVGVAHRADAERFWSDGRERMGQCNLALHPEQTRLSACGRGAAARRTRRAQGTPAPCDCLGLTHRCRNTRHGTWTVRRKTIAQR